MSETFSKNCTSLRALFAGCTTQDKKYEKIIECGVRASPFPETLKKEENLVPGCQSTLYVSSTFSDGVLHFIIWSDALISKGLASIAASTFSGLTPREILLADPAIFQEIGIISSLSPSRVNGFANLLTIIKKNAIQFID